MYDTTMMNVEIMRQVFWDYDNGNPTVGDMMIDNWYYDEKSLKIYRASANFIYFYCEQGQERVLRLVPESERKEKQLLAEIDFMEYLGKNGIPVPKIIPTKAGKKVVIQETKYGSFLGVAFERAPGKHIELEEMSDEKLITWGKLTAKIHTLAVIFKPNQNRKRRTWKEDIKLALKWLDEEEDFKEKIKDLEQWMSTLPEDEFFGLIHYDLEPDNILWLDESYYIIDFDDAAYYPLVAELAFALEDIRKQEPEIEAHMLSKFVEGYTSVKQLPDSWEFQLKQFFTLMDILKYARTQHAYHNTKLEIYPEWLTKMCNRHKNNMKETKKRLLQEWNKEK